MTASALTDTQGIVALAAIVVACCSAIGCLVLARALWRMRGAQRVVLGEGSERDVIAHSAQLQEAFEDLRDYVGDVALRLEQRLEAVEIGLAGAISRRALVRYDAYNELSGQQSVSIALLDDHGSGVVLSCIHHRDQARVYAKQVREGSGELELSPEEEQAVGQALGVAPALASAAGSDE